MEERFYYLNRNTPTPTCVALLVDEAGKAKARGIAICSKKDNFCKSIGREIAKGRAYKALAQESDCLNNAIRRTEILDATVQFIPDFMTSKCMFEPDQLHPFEAGLLAQTT